MPFGGFLDDLPTVLFVAAHVMFLAVGIWAIRRTSGLAFSRALVLYAIAQVVFLGVFGGALTLKMGVLIDQTLMVALVIWIALRATRSPEAAR
jgi:hypothetical protein